MAAGMSAARPGGSDAHLVERCLLRVSSVPAVSRSKEPPPPLPRAHHPSRVYEAGQARKPPSTTSSCPCSSARPGLCALCVPSSRRVARLGRFPALVTWGVPTSTGRLPRTFWPLTTALRISSICVVTPGQKATL